MAFPNSEQLTQLLSPILGHRDLDLEDIKVTRAGKKSKVVVHIDGDTPPDSDVIEKVSQEISAFFDAQEEEGLLDFGAGYTLEVSTPGVGLPLQAARHWRRNRGRKVALNMAGKRQLVRIGALDPAEKRVALISSEGKNAVFSIERLENIDHAVVEIEFALPPEWEKEAAQATFEFAEENSVTRED
ncbi:ribosome maturation factor RimP [Corynebacterium flavescens]|uniref:ribosome maturation factor RimP n=1 Tax=Corynebacterium flavescens TaxID=28028 RepID=UPI00264771A9|nr:ribosome maturation factor RimP [Corynebacterium flavescens]MDN6430426.1 ribosome maturation factor RimP [Corynebacterium flavescens]MDN6474345.1 ribosome maturation factor RimP [Corynebacterium flavescens]MDN6530640.1 ribosome maturation factor RimP [Corynebacterium flavescens]MDN6822614.1 ribosome maturation factor RimP [Corynebacterium flavescens]